MKEVSTDKNILAHTTWNCKYHIVFAPKYRRKVFFEEKRLEIREILRKLCQWKGVEIIEGEVCPDHIHIMVSIPPKMSISGFMGYLKGKSALLIFQKWGNMKFAYRNREFWCKGCSPAYVYGLDILLPLLFLRLSTDIAVLIFLVSQVFFLHKKLFFYILAQTQYGTCNSMTCVLKYSCLWKLLS